MLRILSKNIFLVVTIRFVGGHVSRLLMNILNEGFFVVISNRLLVNAKKVWLSFLGEQMLPLGPNTFSIRVQGGLAWGIRCLYVYKANGTTMEGIGYKDGNFNSFNLSNAYQSPWGGVPRQLYNVHYRFYIFTSPFSFQESSMPLYRYQGECLLFQERPSKYNRSGFPGGVVSKGNYLYFLGSAS